jgi:two-component system nitrogen regulation response regulator GlnG
MREFPGRVLLVDDEKDFCAVLSHLMNREGVKSLMAHDGETALKIVRLREPDLLILDVIMPGINGMEVLRRVKEVDGNLPVIMITGHAGIHEAVEAIRAGAYDYLVKPFDPLELMKVVRQALAGRALNRKNFNLSIQPQDTTHPLRQLMGPSDAVSRLISDVERVGKSSFAVIILGETGTGKELVARAIHTTSTRRNAPFVPVDCGAIPETLLESELFGFEKGAFTGAEVRKSGKFEAAHGGTLFLDEISNMPLSSQARLLRVLQEKTIYRLGGNKPLAIDVRLLVASNRNLEAAAASGSLRRDLFYRLNEFRIEIPPLRDREEDILYLSKRFLDSTNKELRKDVKGFSDSALGTLVTYEWPGNVRQLQSTIRRAVLLADEVVKKENLDVKDASNPVSDPTDALEVQALPNVLSLKEIVRKRTISVEREVLTQVLSKTGGNKAKAARMLQIDYKTIHSKVREYGITINKEYNRGGNHG